MEDKNIGLFKKCNPDYPLLFASLHIETCTVSDADIPSGSGGINRECYTYGQLRHQPIIKEVLSNIKNSRLKQYAMECNSRNKLADFNMFKVEKEYCFWGLRVGPIVKVPSVIELKQKLLDNPLTVEAVKRNQVSAKMIREITYALLRQEVARCCDMSMEEAALAIGNQLDCAPHEDICGYIFMVPNWAHKWFRHDGYVSAMLQKLQ